MTVPRPGLLWASDSIVLCSQKRNALGDPPDNVEPLSGNKDRRHLDWCADLYAVTRFNFLG